MAMRRIGRTAAPWIRGALVAIAAGALASCAPAPRVAPAPVASAAPLAAKPEAGAIRYGVDAARSEIRILTFRAGPLARLGHSHVLLSRDLRGSVAVPDDAAAVAFDLEMPVATLVVDAPDARAQEGAEFASVPTPDDVAGTRRNLLGPAVLDAAQFASLRVSGAGAGGGPDDYTVSARIELRGRATPLDVPVHVVRAGDELVASGEFRVQQSALGLTPFSVALGALQVRDEMIVRFRIVATRAAT